MCTAHRAATAAALRQSESHAAYRRTILQRPLLQPRARPDASSAAPPAPQLRVSRPAHPPHLVAPAACAVDRPEGARRVAHGDAPRTRGVALGACHQTMIDKPRGGERGGGARDGEEFGRRLVPWKTMERLEKPRFGEYTGHGKCCTPSGELTSVTATSRFIAARTCGMDGARTRPRALSSAHAMEHLRITAEPCMQVQVKGARKQSPAHFTPARK